MPRGNGTGPAGAGPMSGRGMGYCAGNDRPGCEAGYGGRRGFGGFFIAGGRRGFRNRFFNQENRGWFGAGRGGFPADNRMGNEAEFLRERAEQMKRSIEEIDARLKELEREEPQG